AVRSFPRKKPMAKKQKQRGSLRGEEHVEAAAAAAHEDAPAANAEGEAAAQEAGGSGSEVAEGRSADAASGGVEEGKEEEAAAAEEEEREVTFDELGLDEQLKRALRKKGLTKTTPIQREAIPLIL
uniref:DEAD-box RNA helicase Q domain-containing protein n=1 Tax=Aegilops tauschii subsp. strangulata TaxID=200361 RepID=A0A453H9R5_AEGTS